MADIEDVAKAVNNLRNNRFANDDIDNQPEMVQAASTRTTVPRSGNDIPGDATVYVHTFGCGHNVSDGEYMSGQLYKNGYRITDEFAAADCYLINSCTVKNPSEDHFVTLVRRAKATKKPVIVAGCVPAGEPNGNEWQDVSVIGVRQIHRVTEVVQESMRGNTIRLFDTEPVSGRGHGGGGGAGAGAAANGGKKKGSSSSNKKKNNNNNADDNQEESTENNNNSNINNKLPSLLLPKVRRNKFIEIVPINVGCLNTCTYCKTKHARGDLQSWPVAEIVQRVKDSIAEGVREIYLTSEDTGAYGIDLGTDIVHLLTEILKILQPTDIMLRLGMTNPPYLLRHLDAFAPLFLHKNFYEFAHIPIQSGSDAILEIMKREYTADEFRTCVKKLRQAAPKMTVATDIICAFPFEGDKEWQVTMDLCQELAFPVLNISRFYPRRGTPAAAMKQIPTDVAKKRTQEISNLFNNQSSIEGSNVSVGDVAVTWVVEVAHDKHHLVGHTKQFVQVLIDPTEAALGDLVQIKITEVLRFCAKATVEKIIFKDSEYVKGLVLSSTTNHNNNQQNQKAMIEDTYGGNPNDDDDDEDEETEKQNKESCCGTGCCSSDDSKEKENKKGNCCSTDCCTSSTTQASTATTVVPQNNSNTNKSTSQKQNNNNNNNKTASPSLSPSDPSLNNTSSNNNHHLDDETRERIILSDKNLEDDDDPEQKDVYKITTATDPKTQKFLIGGIIVAAVSIMAGFVLWKKVSSVGKKN